MPTIHSLYDSLRLHPVLVLGAYPIHAPGHSCRLDDSSRNHWGCALRTRLALLDGVFVFTETGTRRLTEFASGCHYENLLEIQSITIQKSFRFPQQIRELFGCIDVVKYAGVLNGNFDDSMGIPPHDNVQSLVRPQAENLRK